MMNEDQHHKTSQCQDGKTTIKTINTAKRGNLSNIANISYGSGLGQGVNGSHPQH